MGLLGACSRITYPEAELLRIQVKCTEVPELQCERQIAVLNAGMNV